MLWMRTGVRGGIVAACCGGCARGCVAGVCACAAYGGIKCDYDILASNNVECIRGVHYNKFGIYCSNYRYYRVFCWSSRIALRVKLHIF